MSMDLLRQIAASWQPGVRAPAGLESAMNEGACLDGVVATFAS
jgi:hypothetical protein